MSSQKKFSILLFPGSNCEQDCFHVTQNILNCPSEIIWHKDTDLKNPDVVIIPGGFSYGDYLRCGAIAKFSPIMKEVIEFAKKGGKVLGICNGFQILLESGLLPGALMRNKSLKFICQSQPLILKNSQTNFTSLGKEGAVYQIPIAHMDGQYFTTQDGLKELQDNNQIVFQYSNESGELGEDINPNGSVNHIAGIINKEGNVLGMMPHPERVSEELLGGTDGKFIFESLLAS